MMSEDEKQEKINKRMAALRAKVYWDKLEEKFF